MTFLLQKCEIILASGSPVRRHLLEQAGLVVDSAPALIDEDGLRRKWQADHPTGPGERIGQLALFLAEKKAESVAASRPGDVVIIGADQILMAENRIFSKPASLEEAEQHLRFLRGKRHVLYTSVILWHQKRCLWRHLEIPELEMRPFSDDFLKAYLDMEGAGLCQTVGAYRLEGPGVHLFSARSGATETILGLPLLPLLAALRENGFLAS